MCTSRLIPDHQRDTKREVTDVLNHMSNTLRLTGEEYAAIMIAIGAVRALAPRSIPLDWSSKR